MTEFQRYLAEEVAEDHADGLVSRREALRRLGLLGLTGAAAASLLAGAVATEAKALTGGVDARGEPRGRGGGAFRPARSRSAGPQGRRLIGAWASARAAARRCARDPREPRAHRLDPRRRRSARGQRLLRARDRPALRGGRHEVLLGRVRGDGRARRRRSVALRGGPEGGRDRASPPRPGKKVAAIGFCFGGGMTWLLLASKEPRLSAAVPFYGPFPDGGSLAGSNAAVLGVYAELDARVNASRAAARAALRKAGLRHAIATFPGVDHAFFNPTSSRHDPAAAAAAYRRMLSWFGTHLAT